MIENWQHITDTRYLDAVGFRCLIVFYYLLLRLSQHCVYCTIQGVPGGMCETSGECSLGQTIPI